METVRLALERFGPPVYVRRQIVHNTHVVAELEQLGAVFIAELDEVPRGARVIFSAHGVSPAVRATARERSLQVVDATCPLVSKVHAEARRLAAAGHTIVLVGHPGHDEVEGTVGEAPGQTHVVSRVADVEMLEVDDPERVAYLTQTTLAVDETREVVDALRRRFAKIVGPRTSDICYASQNRQDAVKALAARCDVVLVVGSSNSSNSRRLVEVAERHGARAQLIEDESGIDAELLDGAPRVGLTAGASAPEALVQRVLDRLTEGRPTTTEELTVAEEDVQFALPPIE